MAKFLFKFFLGAFSQKKTYIRLMVNIRLLLYLLFLVTFFGCKNTPKVTEPLKEVVQSTGFDQMEEIKEIYYRFPSPDEMLSFIDREKLYFNDKLLLPIDYSKSYLDSKSQTLNLGIYIADLAYISIFQRQKEALEYFQVIYGLSDKLRLSSAFDIRMIQRFEKNIKNADSLKVLTDLAMTNITDYLVKNDKEKIFAIISIGGYIESLYLVFNVAGNYDEKNPIIQRISDQKLVLENLMNYALTYSEDINVAESIKLLHPIRSCYNQLVVTETESTVTKGKDGKLIISGGQKITISPEQYNNLKEVTFAARKSIIENSEN
jgi:hypothetical protein